MNKLNFLVKGSVPDPYKATFIKEGGNLIALCTCTAGVNGLYCKHQFVIIEGSIKRIMSDNAHEVETLRSWLPGTDVEAAYMEVKVAERVFEEAKKNLANLKKKLPGQCVISGTTREKNRKGNEGWFKIKRGMRQPQNYFLREVLSEIN